MTPIHAHKVPNQTQWVLHTDMKVKDTSQKERVSAEERGRGNRRKGLKPLNMQHMKPSKNELEFTQYTGLFTTPPNKNTTERWIKNSIKYLTKKNKTRKTTVPSVKAIQRQTRHYHSLPG